MMASPLANVLKKSLTISSQKVYEAWDWNAAAKELQKKYAKLVKMGDLEGDRTEYEDSLQSCETLLVEKKTSDPKVRAYVYRAELGAAKKQLKDMVGILGKERRGRTSPNGNANHVHIRGDASFNAVFDWKGPGEAVRLLGFVMGHMDKEASSSVLSEAANVEARVNGGDFVEVEVDVVAKTLVEV